MLETTAGERFAARLGLTLFDLLVAITVVVLLAVIGLTVAFGVQETVDEVAYMQLDERGVYEIWIASPEDPDNARQVTDTENGVYDYDVSDDGRYIAYSERDFQTGIAEIYRLDLRTGRVEQVTNCIMQDSDCSAPSFSPDGRYIAYQRVALNNQFSPVGIGAPRIWIVDLEQDQPQSFPLIEDSQVLGREAVWANNGERVAFYDFAGTQIIVYDLTASDDDAAQFYFVPTQMGVMGALSPDGTQLIYPEMGQMRGYLQLADLERNVSELLYDPNAAVDDQQTAWSPDGRYIVIGRRDLEEDATRGTQLYLLNTETSVISPLLIDRRYVHSFFSWSTDSTKLTMQRFQQLDDLGNFYNEGKLEVWTYDLETRQLVKIAEDARAPQWVMAN